MATFEVDYGDIDGDGDIDQELDIYGDVYKDEEEPEAPVSGEVNNSNSYQQQFDQQQPPPKNDLSQDDSAANSNLPANTDAGILDPNKNDHGFVTKKNYLLLKERYLSELFCSLLDLVRAVNVNYIERKVFVGGLNWETTEENLQNYFSKFGVVIDCVIMRDQATGRSRGFGFLTFAESKSIDAIVKQDHYLDGKMIDPKRAVPKLEQEKTEKIFVGGVSPEVNEEEFSDYFSQFGGVIDATLMMDRDTGRPRGFGFITFESSECVDRVLTRQGSLYIKDKLVEVKRAQPKGGRQGFQNQAPIVPAAPLINPMMMGMGGMGMMGNMGGMGNLGGLMGGIGGMGGMMGMMGGMGRGMGRGMGMGMGPAGFNPNFNNNFNNSNPMNNNLNNNVEDNNDDDNKDGDDKSPRNRGMMPNQMVGGYNRQQQMFGNFNRGFNPGGFNGGYMNPQMNMMRQNMMMNMGRNQGGYGQGNFGGPGNFNPNGFNNAGFNNNQGNFNNNNNNEESFVDSEEADTDNKRKPFDKDRDSSAKRRRSRDRSRNRSRSRSRSRDRDSKRNRDRDRSSRGKDGSSSKRDGEGSDDRGSNERRGAGRSRHHPYSRS